MKYAPLLYPLLFIFPTPLSAGPPYDTDDPEPVELHHWEFYCSSTGSASAGAYTGTAPHIEINYGAAPNTQLHVITPMAFYAAKGSETTYGYGDMELGIKYRFINKDSGRLQIGTFPIIVAPTGNANQNLGSGKAQLYLPLWIQKTIGKWTTYGGCGYWYNNPAGIKNYKFAGWQAQYQFIEPANVGAEVYYITADRVGATNELRFRLGTVIDFTAHHHLLFSMGRSIIGNINMLWYLGYQLTI